MRQNHASKINVGQSCGQGYRETYRMTAAVGTIVGWSRLCSSSGDEREPDKRLVSSFFFFRNHAFEPFCGCKSAHTKKTQATSIIPSNILKAILKYHYRMQTYMKPKIYMLNFFFLQILRVAISLKTKCCKPLYQESIVPLSLIWKATTRTIYSNTIDRLKVDTPPTNSGSSPIMRSSPFLCCITQQHRSTTRATPPMLDWIHVQHTCMPWETKSIA